MKKMSKLDRENIQDILALTPMQEGLLFHYLKEPASDLYFTQLCLEISGKADIGVFTAAWNFVVKTNEMLRTFFRWENVKNPLQIILKDHFIQLQYIDFSGKPGIEKINRLEEIKERDRQEGFDLREVPFRIILCKLEDARYYIVISNHHILYDGWSNGTILREFFEAYSQFNKGKSITELKLPQKKKFKEFILRLGQQDKNKEREETFWKQYLGGFAGEAQVPSKRKKSLEIRKKDRSATIRYQRCLAPGTSGSLECFSAAFNITPAVLFYTAWGVLLQRYCNSEDVLFGTTVSGRSLKIPGIENMVGLFINTLPLRLQASWSETIEEVLYKNNRHLQEREAYEHTPLVAIKHYSTLSGSETFFDSLVVVENYPLDQQLTNPNEKLSLTSYSTLEKTHFDVTIGIHTQLLDKITVDFNCSGDCFDEAAVGQMGRYYITVLECMLRNPGKRINEIDILSPAEKKQLVVDFNDTQSEFPREKSLHQLFEEQVEKTPDNIAIVGPLQIKYRTHMTYMTHISYRELNEKSNRLAYPLLEKGVGADTIVAIMIERCVEMIIGIMGILKAGGAYLPIEPDYPQDRIDYMLKDSGAKILLTGQEIAALYSPQALLNLSEGHNFTNDHLAYIIYTSGSTGQPKGVLVEQTSLVNLLMALHQCYPLTEKDTFLLKTSYLFDVSAAELFGWVPGGGRLSILVPGGEKNPREIMDTIKKNRVTHINFVPSVFNVFAAVLNHGNIHKLSSLKYIFLAGEVLLPEQVNRFGRLNSEIVLENIYGPTEGTVYAGRYSLSQWDGVGSIPIGKPLQNIKLYILDKNDHLQPVGVPGELCIGGIGLARGYLNRPELTNQKLLRGVQGGGFLEKSPPGRLYKTGDLARWLSDGNIEFLGRRDHQVKIRGFRIELGEIESQLYTYKDITEAVVTMSEGRRGEGYLCGYIVTETKVDVLSLKQYLARKLPDYMVPSYFVQLDKIPLTSIGKIDRKQLPHPRESQPGKKGVDIEPKSDLEKRVADIWKEVLRLDSVSINDNFFDVGGNSLSIIRLNSRLNEVFHKDIPLVTLFKYPTISSLAGYLNEGEEEAVESRVRESSLPGEISVKTGAEIAVIGMAGRFPGARNVHEFWENLKSGVESIAFLTEKERIESDLDPELVSHTGYIPAKGILEDKNHFDTFFFGYTPAEAKIMDPQVRIFHECCWEALEDAGYNPENYEGLIGLYAGASPNPYWEILPLKSLGGGQSYAQQWDAVQFSDKDYLSTRIAYKLDLKGPGVTMQTACSTSLVVVALACQGLLGGTSDIALAGCVSITLYDEFGHPYQEGTIMSPDGHCRAFDARANGTVGGNGVGVVVLKHLEKAVNDKDTIYAVIKGFGINNDGKNKVGFTAPSVEGQAGAIRAAQRMARIEPGSIGYVETHGTGTPLGDPIEIEALKHAFGKNTAAPGKGNYCGLGSVKTNIGHLDAAAGIAGLIKTILMLKHRLIPPSLHFDQPNPAIDFENSPFYVNKELKPWHNDEYPLRAGVSSFGLGGTNAHVVLEEWPIAQSAGRRAQESEREYQLILLSAQTPSALDKMTENLAEYFKKNLLNRGNHDNPTNPGPNFSDAAYTLQVGRKAFAHRSMLVCSNPEQVVRKIQAGEVETGRAKKEKSTVIFMFSGQGSQFVNMGLDLYREEPVFRDQMDYCFKHLENLTGIDMKPVLYPDKEVPEAAEIKIGQFLYTTPIKFTFEYSLAKLLMSWGIQPDAMIGHSFGEYVAACLSGVFSLEDALFMAALRGGLMHGLPDGAMLSVPLSENQLKPLLNNEISLAAVNGESMCVVSGPVQVIDAFAKELNEKGHDCLRYHVPKAGHSRMVEPIIAEFKEKIGGVKFSKPQIPFISGLTGKWITAEEAVDPGYWARHLRETVRFADGLTTLFKEPDPIFLQVGPGRGLTLFVQQHPDKNLRTAAVNMVRHRKEEISDVQYTLNKIGQLWLMGLQVDWPAVNAGEKRFRVPLPTYPFEGACYHPPAGLFNLGAPVEGAGGESSLRKKPDISDWFYIPVWERCAPLPANAAAGLMETSQQGNYLVFLDNRGLGEQLVERLKQEGHQVAVVQKKKKGKGPSFKKINEAMYSLHPAAPGGYVQLLHQLQSQGRFSRQLTVIHMWCLDPIDRWEQETDEFDAKQIKQCLSQGYYSLLYLAKAIGERNIIGDIRLEAVTAAVHEITGREKLEPARATVLGPLKVIPQEYPNVKCRNIDIDLPVTEDLSNHLIHRLMREFSAGSPDPPGTVIAYRDRFRWIQSFRPLQLPKPRKELLPLKQGGVYWITGGLGNIGLILARHLAKSLQARLVLTGRSAFPLENQWNQWLSSHPHENRISGKIRILREIKGMAAGVLVLQADASNFHQMKDALIQAEERFGTIDGVIHSAGIVGDQTYRTVKELRYAECEQQFKPKVYGLPVLEKLFREHCLDFCLLMSSNASILGGLGFTAYSAANCFMDAFVCFHNRTSSAWWVSVNWDTWQSQDQIHHAQPVSIGTTITETAVKPGEGAEVLERILAFGELSQVIQCAEDFQTRIDRWVKLEALNRQDKVEREHEPTAPSSYQPRPLLANPYVGPTSTVEQQLADIWKHLLGYETVGVEDNFFELSGDSLKAVIAISKIHKQLNIKIPINEFFSPPTIEGLARYIGRTKGSAYFPIKPVEKREYYGLSSAQKRMWVLNLLEKNSTALNILQVIELEGTPDRGNTEEIFHRLIRRHESLRTSFELVKDKPVQRVHDDVKFKLEYYELKKVEVEVKVEEKLLKGTGGLAPLPEESHHSSFIIHHSFIVRPFDLSQAPLLRVGLIKREHEKYNLVLNMHHIIGDGISMGILLQELKKPGKGELLPVVHIQYKDFLEWQNRMFAADAFKSQEQFWLKEFKKEAQALDLPTDYPRPAERSYEGSTVCAFMDKDETRALKAIAMGQGMTLSMVLFSIYSILLSKLSGQEDIVIGLTIFSRQHPDLEQTVGMFVNMLALRTYPQAHKSFGKFLLEVKEKTFEAYENQDYPFEKLVEKAAVKRKKGRNPLFDAEFVLQPDVMEVDSHHHENMNSLPLKIENTISNFDIFLMAKENSAGISLNLHYWTKLFKQETIELFLKYYARIIKQVTGNKEIDIRDIALMEEDKKDKIVQSLQADIQELDRSLDFRDL